MFYAILLVIAILEVIRYEYVSTSKSLTNVGRIIYITVDIFFTFIMLIILAAGSTASYITPDMYSGVYAICFVALAMDISLIRKALLAKDNGSTYPDC